MKLHKLHVTQRKLRNVDQLTQMLEAIANDELLPQVRLAEFEDGVIHIEDGHHRCLSYWLSGREELNPHEYVLVQKEEKDQCQRGSRS